MTNPLNIKYITKYIPSHWKLYKTLQLESVKLEPNAFERQYQNEIKLDDVEWQNRYQKKFSRGNISVFAFYNNKYIGKVSAVRTKQDVSNNTITLYGVYVNAKFHRQGIATSMLNILQDKIKSKYKYKVTTIHLFVTDTQTNAINFYQKEEFKILYKDKLIITENNIHPGIAMEKQLQNSKTRPQILDLGCGRGAKISNLEKRGNVIGIDISADFIKYCQQLFPKYVFKVMDGLNLEFSKDTFDEVYCQDVIEHVDNPDLLLKNISKVLKSNGTLYLDIPYFQSEKLLTTFNPTYPNQVHHQTIFPFSKIINILNDNNFKIINCQYHKFFDNIYLMSYFLRNKHIQNQQGDFVQESDGENLLSYVVQHIYDDDILINIVSDKNYQFYNNICQNILKISLVDLLKSVKIFNEISSPFFPKTISLKCKKSKKPDNKISSVKPKRVDINLSKFANENNVDMYQQQLNKAIKINKELINQVDSISHELKVIKDSQFYKLWPIYTKFKSILK